MCAARLPLSVILLLPDDCIIGREEEEECTEGGPCDSGTFV